ncbi:uridine kinase [Saccharopolyspora sp. NPDC047091]|uniref:uridine kinase family protein n=1 Tax=Saccharopolyspora sp. NPDC047091 TaxID=3155924 RepID=UPI0033FFA3DE
MSEFDRAAEAAIAHLLAAPARLGPVRVLAVDGPSGAGKSTFADLLLSRLGAVDARLVRTDDFATWDEPVEWWPRLRAGVLEPLAAGSPGGYRRTEWPGGRPVPGAHVPVPVPEVLVLEGVSAARAAIAPRLSTVVWVEPVGAALRLERAVARDGEDARGELRRWQRFEQEWFAADGTRARADVRIGPAATGAPG